MMRLALITAFPPSKGTLVEYGDHLARVMAEKPEVSDLLILADRVEDDSADPANVQRVWGFGSVSNTWNIVMALRKFKPDAVLFNLQFATFGGAPVPAALGLLAPLCSRLMGIPTITLMHNIFETIDLKNAGYANSSLKEQILRIGGQLFTRMLLMSHKVATTMPRYVEILRENYGAKNVFLAPHGAFENPGPPLPLPQTKQVMAFGKFGTYKRVETLLEAHKILLERDPSIELVIAGSDSPNAAGYLEQIQKQYSDLPNVTYTGYVPEDQVARIFGDAMVVAFPYTSTTGSSGVLHQAGSYARAVVMPNIGDLGELVEEEGYLAEFFEPGNASSLADALWLVVSDSDHAKHLGLVNYGASVGVLLSEVVDWYLLHFESLRRKHEAKSFRSTKRTNLPL